MVNFHIIVLSKRIRFIPLEAEHPAVSAAGMNARSSTASAGFNTLRELLTGFIQYKPSEQSQPSHHCKL